jgi:acyl-CoA dehydrogenase
LLKVQGTELRQRLTELAVEVEGRAAMAAVGTDARAELAGFSSAADAMAIYLNDRAASIYAGANEIQRNIIAAALLR